MKNIINIQNAEIGYVGKKNKISLAEKINLQASKGEIIALIGVNGAGKSTLLRSVLGIIPFLSGEIYVEDKNLNEYSSSEKSKKISFVSTEIVRVNHMRVSDLVAVGRYPHTGSSGVLSAKDIQIVKNSLRKVNLLGYYNKKLSEISDGERQKVMIARALAQDTQIIILDEPASFLDIENKYTAYNILKELAENEGKTVVFSTHDLNIALKSADKIWLIKESRIIEGAPEDLILDNIFDDVFDSDKIIFDSENGDFKSVQKLSKPVNIYAENINKFVKILTEKAINRIGFYLSESKTDFEIRIKNNQKKYSWNLKNNKKEISFTDIYNLISFLKKNT